MVGYRISRGRPALNITSVLMKATKAPSPTQNDNKKHHKKDENPWFSVMDHASTHHNDHVVKVSGDYPSSSSILWQTLNLFQTKGYSNSVHVWATFLPFTCFQIVGHRWNDIYTCKCNY